MGQRSFGYATSPGIVREQNEDSLCIRPDLGLWAVADGMGGYKAGDMASRITVEQLADDVGNGVSLSLAISEVHQKILNIARTDAAFESMGSTVVALKVDGNAYEIAWVGDSRAYLWNGRQLVQLTRDHSYVQSLIDAGTITEAEAEIHPERHAITQALGAEGIAAVEVGTINGIFKENDMVLLCSDGLSNEVGDDEMSSILAQHGSEQMKAEQLIDRAEQNGGADNISVILVGPDPAVAAKAIDEKPGAPWVNPLVTEGKGRGYQFWIWMVILFLTLFLSVMFVYDII